MSTKTRKAAVGSGAAASVVIAIALAGCGGTTHTASKTYVIKATLGRKYQVPVPKDALHATGLLTGKLVLAGKKSSFTWQLRVSGLSGRLVAGEVAIGAPGESGTTALPLCVKCAPTAHGAYIGPYVANPAFVKVLVRGGMYATVTTKLNPKGEIRGQIKATSP